MASNNRGGRLLWLSVHDEELKAGIADNCSFARTAARINAKFGTAYSRNAAIGRAARLNIVSPNRPGRLIGEVRKTGAPKPRIRIVAANGNSDKKRIIETNEPALPELRCVEIVPRNITLLDLDHRDCRYPYGAGADIVFCGHPKAADSSYCRPHQVLTRGSAHPLSKAGSMAATRARRIAYKRSMMGAA